VLRGRNICQEFKLAARQPTAVANPFMDLPFSPRAAFIWDNTRKAVVWMNAAARKKFGVTAEGLSKALPESVTRAFASCLERKGTNTPVSTSIKLRVARHSAFNCSVDVLEIAGGSLGLAVTEMEPQQLAVPPLELPGKGLSKDTRAKSLPKRGPASKKRSKAQKLPASTARLTPEELQSFLAIGRKMRRLCRDMQGADTALQTSPPESKKSRAPRPQAAPALPFCAFDAVLLLDKTLAIIGCEGRPQNFGWRKAALQGRQATHLLEAGEQAIFYRMVRKLSSAQTQICRETLVITDETGGGAPYRAVLGHWDHGGACYFLAFLSLKLPQRLKKQKEQLFNAVAVTRLAA
jgi:hypothetical protein